MGAGEGDCGEIVGVGCRLLDVQEVLLLLLTELLEP